MESISSFSVLRICFSYRHLGNHDLTDCFCPRLMGMYVQEPGQHLLGQYQHVLRYQRLAGAEVHRSVHFSRWVLSKCCPSMDCVRCVLQSMFVRRRGRGSPVDVSVKVLEMMACRMVSVSPILRVAEEQGPTTMGCRLSNRAIKGQPSVRDPAFLAMCDRMFAQ